YTLRAAAGAPAMTGNAIHHKVQQQFGQNPEGYVTSAAHAQGSELPRMVELVQPGAGWRALDVATGGGHTARTFAPHVQHIIAADLTFKMLLAARGHFAAHDLSNLSLHQLDAQALPYAAGCFDLVTCRIAPHHFPDPAQFVIEAARVTRPGGIVAVVDQIMPEQRKAAQYVNAFERLRDPSHAWAYSLPRWLRFFEAAGLDVWHTEMVSRRHTLGSWAERMHCAPEVVTRLHVMLVQAPEPALAWMEPELPQSGDASFFIRQALILGRKTSS
ncbi:MAG: methyltransferase domain-containing protein, partial [Anaerolineae bacterium]|nr:methyltransferase domain-containing protein [Anaerolineae bacterium]